MKKIKDKRKIKVRKISAENQTMDMTEKDNLYPNLKELLYQLKSENADSESASKSEISEPPPGYEEIFGSYISEG